MTTDIERKAEFRAFLTVRLDRVLSGVPVNERAAYLDVVEEAFTSIVRRTKSWTPETIMEATARAGKRAEIPFECLLSDRERVEILGDAIRDAHRLLVDRWNHDGAIKKAIKILEATGRTEAA